MYNYINNIAMHLLTSALMAHGIIACHKIIRKHLIEMLINMPRIVLSKASQLIL